MKRVIESAAPIWKDDINYPGVPADPPVAARTTSRATVTYETYVLQYAARQRGHVLLATAGVVLALGAMYLVDGTALLVILISLGVGGLMSGGVGFAIAADAHASYTRNLAVSVSETYERRPTTPPPATVRPYVASSNGDGRTTNTGRLNFTAQVWKALFDRALANGGVISRDGVARPAGVGRDWYHGDGYGHLLGELTRLGFIDGRNRITPAALSWYEAQIPLPLAAFPVRTGIERTNDRPNGANGANDAPVEQWGEE